MTDDTPNVPAMVEESLQILEVIGESRHRSSMSNRWVHFASTSMCSCVFRAFEMGELVIHQINQLWTVITSYIVIQTTLKLHTTDGIN